MLAKRVGQVQPQSYDEFLSTTGSAKKRIYARAIASLRVRPLEHKDGDVKGFVKFEKLRIKEKKKAPRVISPRDPRFNVEYGRFIRPLEHRVYRVIDDLFGYGRTVAKNMNVVQMGAAVAGKFEAYSDPVMLEFDFSYFDSTIGRMWLTFIMGFYLMCFSGDVRKALEKYCRRTLRCKVRIVHQDGVVKYNHDKRCSGDMDTSLGNILIAVFFLMYLFDQFHIPYVAIDAGDDANPVVPSHLVDEFCTRAVTTAEMFGLVLKVGKRNYIPETVEFCQSHPIRINATEWRMVRNFPECIDKDLHSTLRIHNEGSFQAWIGAIGNGGLALCSGVPILQSFYEYLIRGSHGRSDFDNPQLLAARVFGNFNAFGLTERHREIDPLARVSFALAFDFSPDLQIHYERWFDSHTPEYGNPDLVPEFNRNTNLFFMK